MPHLNSLSADFRNKRLNAEPEDFERIFAKQNTDLFRLSLQLTADAEKAETCLILAMRDCFFRSSVSRDRAYAWARRMVIRNAIRVVWGRSNDVTDEAGLEFQLQPSEFAVESLRESLAILTLPEFDRLAFVICFLERYSILDCALLLRKTPQEVHEAILRATDQILSAEKPISDDGAIPSSVNVSGAITDGRKYLKGSCGSVFDYDCQ